MLRYISPEPKAHSEIGFGNLPSYALYLFIEYKPPAIRDEASNLALVIIS